MAIKLSDYASGVKTVANSCCGGDVVVTRFEFTVTEDLLLGDVIEIGYLPSYNVPVDAILVTDALGGTVDVGLITGEAGTQDDTRVTGTELYLGAATGDVVRLSQPSAFTLKGKEGNTGIGITLGGNVAATGQKITLVLFYSANI